MRQRGRMPPHARVHTPPDHVAHSRRRHVVHAFTEKGLQAVSRDVIVRNEMANNLNHLRNILALVAEFGAHYALQFAVATAASNPVSKDIALAYFKSDHDHK